MIQIELDKPRNLKFDLAALRDLEAQMNGLPLGTIVNHLNQLGIGALIAALWAGLKHEDRALTPKLTMTILSDYLAGGGDLAELQGALDKAIVSSGLFGKAGESAGKDKTATTA